MSQQETQEIRVKGKAARIRGATWTHDQVKKLFDVWNQPDIYQGLLNEKKKQDIFKRMAATLVTQGVNRTWSECRAKIKNLKADFRKAMEKKISFRYYSEMRKIMNLDGSATRTETATSSPAESLHHYSMSEEGEGEEEEEPISRPGTSTSSVDPFQTSTSPIEYATPSPHHPQPTSPYHQYQMEEGEEEREDFGTREIDQDSSSRSSMVITHVVSNVIEPVTTVIMPSSSQRDQEVTPAPVTEQDRFDMHTRREHGILEEQTPIRLEFVVDESENVVLQHSTSPGSRQEEQIHSSSFEDQQSSPRSHSEIPAPSPSPILKTRLIQTSIPVPPRKTPQPQHTPSRPTTPRKRRTLFPDRRKPEKKQKELETLNKQALETISNLLKDSSQCLLDELQNAEQRFISWEEEKRNEERKREEAMFTKLIGAMSKSSSPPSKTNENAPDPDKSIKGKDTVNFVNDFADMSRTLNGMLTDEVKATEESVRQWELKMQRQEGRHTEKLFAMIINAIKRPSEVS